MRYVIRGGNIEVTEALKSAIYEHQFPYDIDNNNKITKFTDDFIIFTVFTKQ